MSEKNINIEIDERIYNGKVSDGKTVNKTYSFAISDGVARLEVKEKIWPDRLTNQKEEFSIEPEKIKLLTEIIENLKEKYLFNEELDKTRRIPERLKFVDIYVENVHIEIEKESELYKNLIKIMKIN